MEDKLSLIKGGNSVEGGGEQDNYWLIILVFNDNLYLVWEAVVKD